MNEGYSVRQAIEGDFVETIDSLIFDVKGFLHPPDRTIAYLRYVADPSGERQRQGQKFRKLYDLDERRSFLAQFHRSYLYYDSVFNREMQGVPRNKVLKHYDPRDKVRKLARSSVSNCLETRSLELLDLLRVATSLPTRDFGISGSILVGLCTHTSDIDLIVYGGNSGVKVVEALRILHNEIGPIRRYTSSELSKLRESRLMSTSIPLQDFVWHEERKALQGVFRETDYFIRCIKNPSEIPEKYGENTFRPIGQATIEAVVVDDSDGIFTPSRYLIGSPRVIEGPKRINPSEIVSFRGRFCEQAKTGERILAKGCLERVVGQAAEYYRLIVGEDRSDKFMVRGH